LIDGERGVVKTAVNMAVGGWKDVPLGAEVSRRCAGMLVVVENDACAAAVGEGYFGSAVGSRDYALLTVGSGLGSGVISGGQLVRGAFSTGTDLGHYSLDPDNGLKCLCGMVGCAETLCSGPGLVNAFRLVMKNGGIKSAVTDGAELNSAAILKAAQGRDAGAIAAVEMMGRALGHIAAVVGSVIDPDVIVIGGGLGIAAFDLMKGGMEMEYRRRTPGCQGMPAFRASTLASSALGSAGLVWSRSGTTTAT
jgi:glucokinase